MWNLGKLEQQFSIVTEEKPNALWTASAADMTQPETMSSLLSLYRTRLKAKDDRPAATYFCGYFRSVAYALQFGLSVRNRALALPLERLTVQLAEAGGYDRFWFVVRPLEEEPAPAGPAAREQWLRGTLTRFYRDTVRPLVRTLHELTGLPEGQLWGQFPMLFQYYEDLYREDAAMQPYLAALEADYAFLRRGLDPMEAFGRAKNPFDVPPRYTESLTDSGRRTLLRTACCLYYCLEGGEYCFSCPRLKESERERLRAQARQAANG